jgi:hypothetical protein
MRHDPDFRLEVLNVPEGSLLRIPVRLIPGGILGLDHARTLERFRRMIDLAGRPAHEGQEAWDAFDAESEEPPWYCFLIRSQGDFRLRGILESIHAHRARIDLARIGLAIRIHAIRHGAPPASLDAVDPDLLPEIPLDPWCGEPYRYAPAGDGSFRLWGVHRDGVDDGGDPRKDDVWR